MIWNTVKIIFNANCPVLILFLEIVVYLRFFNLKNHREKSGLYKEFFNIIAIIYIFLLFQLLTNVELNRGSGYNIVPFTEILRYEIGSKLFYYNVIGNIVVFMPFGYIVASYVKSKNIWPSMIISLIVSTTVEFVQLNIGRSFDIDDIILNVLGGIFGYLLYVGLSAIKKHLPKVFQGEAIYNIICLIIIGLIVIYLLRVMGVFVF